MGCKRVLSLVDMWHLWEGEICIEKVLASVLCAWGKGRKEMTFRCGQRGDSSGRGELFSVLSWKLKGDWKKPGREKQAGLFRALLSG